MQHLTAAAAVVFLDLIWNKNSAFTMKFQMCNKIIYIERERENYRRNDASLFGANGAVKVRYLVSPFGNYTLALVVTSEMKYMAILHWS